MTGHRIGTQEERQTERNELHHRVELETGGVPHNFRQELGGGWTLRFGPLRAVDVARALSAFVS